MTPVRLIPKQKAICKSYNTVPAQILRKMGFETSFEYATQKFHLKKLIDPTDKNTSSLAVGGTYKGVTTLEMASAYAAFGNGGKYFEPYCYYKVTNSNGSKVLLQHEESEGEQILSPDTADIMNELLQTVVTDAAGQATGLKYALKNSVMFAKTGTTTEDKDRWFVGGTPYYVAAVWFGCDTPKQISNYVSGSPSGAIFDAVMNAVHRGLESKSFTKFSPIVEQHAYCTATGLLASDNCPSKAMGWYSKENLPGRCTSCTGVVPETPTEPTVTEPQSTSSSEPAVEGTTDGANSETTNGATSNPAP